MRIPLWINKNKLYREKYHRIELNKIILKSLLSKNYHPKAWRIYWHYKLQRFGKTACIAYQRRGCQFTGSGRSVFKQFKASRHRVKHLASYGLLPGVRKSSF